MGILFSSLQNLLTQPAGTLTYNLVLVVSIVGALQAVYLFPGERIGEKRKRALFGLGLLLILRIVPFSAGLAAGQGLTSLSLILPLVDRVVFAMSLVLVGWLWNFPDTEQNYDIASIVVGLLVAMGGILSMMYWISGGGLDYFSDSTLGLVWAIISLVIVLLSMGLLFAFKNDGWMYGVSIHITFALGELLQLLFLTPETDYSGISRLFQIAAFPLLFLVTQRMALALVSDAGEVTETLFDADVLSLAEEKQARDKAKQKSDSTETGTTGPQRIPQKVFHSALALASSGDPKEVCQLITLQIAHALVADICLLTSPPALDGDVTIYCGYDLIRESTFDGKMFEQRLIPGFAEAMRNGRTFQIPTTSTTNTLSGFARELNLKEVGNFLAMPIMDTESKPVAVVILLSPYSNYVWTGEDQGYFRDAAPKLAHILRTASDDVQNMSILDKTLDDLEQAQLENQKIEQDNEGLRVELAALQAQALDFSEKENQSEPLDTAEKEAFEKTLNTMRTKFVQIEAENEELKASLNKLRASQKVAEAATGEAEQAAGELTLVLGEIADLKGKLKKAKGMIEDLRKQVKQAADEKLALETANAVEEISEPTSEATNPVNISDEQVEVISSIAQDLRQPMSSIIGYADLLLSESVGILGALQRKFLDRIKSSTDRMNKLVSDLIQITVLDAGNVELHSETVDVMAVMDEAINSAGTQLRERKIVLRVDIPDDLPQMTTDRDALSQIVSYLLQNAGAASPLEGEVSLQLEKLIQEDLEFICIRVADSGEGIPEDDLPRVFSRLYRADNPLIQGVGDTGVGLSIVKALTKSLNGEIEVESTLNEGSIFSACLPVHSKIDKVGG